MSSRGGALMGRLESFSMQGLKHFQEQKSTQNSKKDAQISGKSE